jgi:hypothetical protein
VYCAGPRYYIDCMGECHGCGCGGGSFCPSCDGLVCGCALGTCANRHVGCTEFRYGQCHQEIACSGRISCRVVSCTPPWLLDSTCSTVAQTDEATANHFAPCQNGTPPQEDTVTPQDIENITAAVVLALRQQFAPGGELYTRVIQAVNTSIAENAGNIVRDDVIAVKQADTT